ncbi:MAG: helix-turn-helix domain-containing protein [Microbacterium sp.]
MANSPSGDFVTDRIVRIFETLGADRTVQTAAEIGRRAGLPSSTAARSSSEEPSDETKRGAPYSSSAKTSLAIR